MRNYFTKSCLSFSLRRENETELKLVISSDYANSARKSQQRVNEKRLIDDVTALWKSIKTKKLLRLSAGFSQIDWYDSDVDMYDVPYAKIERGLKIARIGYDSYGSTPKDWSMNIAMRFADTTANTPILEAIKATLGYTFTDDMKKAVIKAFRPVLQKKQKYGSYELPYEESNY